MREGWAVGASAHVDLANTYGLSDTMRDQLLCGHFGLREGWAVGASGCVDQPHAHALADTKRVQLLCGHSGKRVQSMMMCVCMYACKKRIINKGIDEKDSMKESMEDSRKEPMEKNQ